MKQYERNNMNPQSFIQQLETGKTVELDNVQDFLQACKICRKHYGRKSVIPADSGWNKGCIILMQENPEKAGTFRIPMRPVIEYCRKNKIDDMQDFHALYIDKREIDNRKRDTRFFNAIKDFKSRCHETYRNSTIKGKEKLIKKLEKL